MSCGQLDRAGCAECVVPSDGGSHVDPEVMKLYIWKASVSLVHRFQQRLPCRRIALSDAELIIQTPPIDRSCDQPLKPGANLRPRSQFTRLDVSNHGADRVSGTVMGSFETLNATSRGMSAIKVLAVIAGCAGGDGQALAFDRNERRILRVFAACDPDRRCAGGRNQVDLSPTDDFVRLLDMKLEKIPSTRLPRCAIHMSAEPGRQRCLGGFDRPLGIITPFWQLVGESKAVRASVYPSEPHHDMSADGSRGGRRRRVRSRATMTCRSILERTRPRRRRQ